MRRIPGAKPGTLVAYVPEAYGNRFDPEPITVWLKTPSEADKRAHMADVMDRVDIAAVKPGEAPKMSLTMGDVFERKRKAILRFVDKVENYVDQGGEQIVNAAMLWERGEQAVHNEVETEIERLLYLGDAEKKDSAGSCGSSTAASSRPDGNANSVTTTLPVNATVVEVHPQR